MYLDYSINTLINFKKRTKSLQISSIPFSSRDPLIRPQSRRFSTMASRNNLKLDETARTFATDSWKISE